MRISVRKLKKFIAPLIALLVVSALVVWYMKRKKPEEAMEIPTAAVERQDVELTVTAVGDLQPLTTVEVKANVAGEIVELAVDRGDAVLKGDLIARIDPTETRSEYEQAIADVTAAEAQVRQAQANYRREGRTSDAQIRAAEQSYATALTKVDQARSNLEYQRKVTDSDIKQAEEGVRSAQARLKTAQTRADAQPAITRAAIERAEAEVRASQEALAKLREATHPQEVSSARTALEAARVALRNDEKNLERVRKLNARGGASLQELEAAERSLADAQDGYETARVASQTIERKHSAEMKQATAQLEQAQAALASARSNGVEVDIALDDLESARAAVREAQAGLDRAKAGKAQDAVREQEIRAARSGSSESRAQLSVARANALSVAAQREQVAGARAQTQKSKANLENAEKNLNYTTIVAPRDGLVIDRFVEEGTVVTSGRSSVATGTNVITIADVSRMFVLTEVNEADIGGVKQGMPAKIQIETFRDETFKGKVVQVYPSAQTIDNVVVFLVRVEVDNPEQRLRPGMTAEVTIICDRREQVLAVPSDAVFTRDGEEFAQVLDPGAKEPREVKVKTGLSNFEVVEIVSGLKEGDQLVLEPSGGGFGGMGGPGGNGGRGGPGGGRPGGSQDNMRRMMRMGPGGGMGGGRR